jgi:O-antigen ligase
VAGILVPYYRETLYVLRRNWFLVALVVLALVSGSWAAMPALALRKAIAVLGTTLFGIALAVRLSPEEQVRLLSWLCRTIAVLSLACVIFFPSYGISPEHQWQGVFAYKSVLGFVMALSILVEWQLPTPTAFSRTLNRLALLLSAVLLFFAGSLTPTIALLGSLLLVEAYKFAAQRLRISQAIIVLAMLLMMSSGVAMFLASSEKLTNALGRSSDLTGRTEIWRWVGASILERPLLGYGYSGFWSEVSAASTGIDHLVGGMIMYAHNGYLEVLLSLGIVGLALTLAFLGLGIRRAIYWSDRMGLWPLAFLLFFLLQNFTECSILLQDLEWAICVAVVVSTDSVLLATDEEDDEELLLEPSEELT